jgi:formylglycine-generating enzyme required for sulfatase activity
LIRVLWALSLVGCTVLGDRLDGIADGDHCTSGVRDADETDDDCGGADCGPCFFDSSCRANSDCSTGFCASDDGFQYCACPPEMVSNVRPEDGVTFCIDRLEVSVGNYQAFLSHCAETGTCTSDCDGPWTVTTPVSGAPSVGCTGDEFDPVNAPNRPVVCVYLCDAFAYCKALGKRLCGDYFDDAYPVTYANDPNVSEWYNACSRSDDQDFPYGEDLVSSACNGSATASADVGTFPGCGVPNGPLDMSGNVREWEAVYDEAGSCFVRGGSFASNDDPNELSCSRIPTPSPVDCGDVAGDIGFRCCSG